MLVDVYQRLGHTRRTLRGTRTAPMLRSWFWHTRCIYWEVNIEYDVPPKRESTSC